MKQSASKPTGVVRFHGREYKTVALRVMEFRARFPMEEGWSIRTEPVQITESSVCFKAEIIDPSGRVLAVGHAEERRTSKGINASSALENAETSAVGRALAAAGFTGTEYASADELIQALRSQHGLRQPGQRSQRSPASSPAPKAELQDPSWVKDHKRFCQLLEARGLDYRETAAYCERRGWGRPSSWGTPARQRFLEELDAGELPEVYQPSPQENVA